MTNSSQTVTGTLTQDGFGNYVTSTGSSSNPYMFAATSGYRNDGDAGLTHVGARYYDAQVGRFVSRDTYLDQHPYLYCDHDPATYLDPSGHSEVVIGIVVVVIVVGGAYWLWKHHHPHGRPGGGRPPGGRRPGGNNPIGQGPAIPPGVGQGNQDGMGSSVGGNLERRRRKMEIEDGQTGTTP